MMADASAKRRVIGTKTKREARRERREGPVRSDPDGLVSRMGVSSGIGIYVIVKDHFAPNSCLMRVL